MNTKGKRRKFIGNSESHLKGTRRRIIERRIYFDSKSEGFGYKEEINKEIRFE